MTFHARLSQVTATWCVILAATGCNREGRKVESNTVGVSHSRPAAAATNKRDGYRNACDLLTIEEASAVVGVPVTAREMSDADGTDQEATATNRLADRSACWWEGPDGQARLMVKGYWTEGKQWWKINAAARGMAKGMIQEHEGVVLDSVVKAGPVSGLGDQAFFSPLLPSLVLKDDIMLEITMPIHPNPEAQFRPLVTKILSRL
jgi:hypothetical protein